MPVHKDPHQPASGSFAKLMTASPATQAPAVDAPASAAEDVRTPADVRARTRAPVPTADKAPTESADARALSEALQARVMFKRHLSSFTFRFRSEELEALDRLVEAINRERPQKISKNDLVRLAVNWLVQDYDACSDASVLAQMFRRP